MVPEQRGSTSSRGGGEGGPVVEPDGAYAIPHLEFDESVPPRPEEEIADVARSERDEAVPVQSS